ncbi:MAG: tRNA glutamyl-Q(34) synthetase GluQRS [Aestuariivita sp.]|nr:tRNA glutamyl-Q(34) synthetase GluQRS [Aestuariivita sp.]
MKFKTRFAPSPTGPLHLGHAYSALIAYNMALAAEGVFLLRIENTDSTRCRLEWEDQIYKDLTWLGLTWPTPVLHQSDRKSAYDAAISKLSQMGLVFPCSCRRADIAAAVSAPQEGVAQFGPDGRIYPGTCRDRSLSDAQQGDALRLNITKAVNMLTKDLIYKEIGLDACQEAIACHNLKNTVGDVVLRRRIHGDTAYHLAVVIDDHEQNITHVVRGQDLKDATQIHVLLQSLLGLRIPVFHHHTLIRDKEQKRLAKRSDAKALAKYRINGATPDEIRRLVGL